MSSSSLERYFTLPRLTVRPFVLFVMRHLTQYIFQLLFGLVAVAAASGCGAENAGSDERFILLHQNKNRFVNVHLPEGYEPGNPTPVLLALHGSGDSGSAFQKGAGLDKQADKFGFIVVYPTASTANWAEGCNCNRPDLDGVDDVGFLDKVTQELDEKYSIDKNRLYIMGFSQGGMFAQRLACERSDTYKAFASVAAMISEPLSRVCFPPRPVSMMMINGTADSVLPFNGIPSGSFATKGAYETLVMWKNRNSCVGTINSETYRDSSPRTILHKVQGCPENADVRLYEIGNGPHVWPREGLSAPALLVEYFGLNQ